MLNEELLQKIRRIELVAKKNVDSYLQGSYHTLFKGQGLEFQEVREYTENDDARMIDWNVTARSGKPFVKLYREERELVVMIVADISGSTIYGMHYGVQDVLATVAASLTFSAIKNSDKVGLLLFSDRIEEYIPPRRGKNHLLTVIRTLLTTKPEGRKTDPDVAFRFLNKIMKRKTLLFFLSDMLFEEIPDSLGITASKHEIVPIGIIDDILFKPVVDGAIRTIDPETGETGIIDFSSPSRMQERYFTALKEESLKKIGLKPMWIRSSENFMDDLVNEFKRLASIKKR